MAMCALRLPMYYSNAKARCRRLPARSPAGSSAVASPPQHSVIRQSVRLRLQTGAHQATHASALALAGTALSSDEMTRVSVPTPTARFVSVRDMTPRDSASTSAAPRAHIGLHQRSAKRTGNVKSETMQTGASRIDLRTAFRAIRPLQNAPGRLSSSRLSPRLPRAR